MSYEKKSNKSSAGIGLCGGVFLIFLALKLAQVGVVASWSWWWVTAPLWLPLVAVIGILLIFFIISVLVNVLSRK